MAPRIRDAHQVIRVKKPGLDETEKKKRRAELGAAMLPSDMHERAALWKACCQKNAQEIRQLKQRLAKAIEHFDEKDKGRIIRMAQFMDDAFEGWVQKNGKKPLVLHSLRVMVKAAEAGADAMTICVCGGHDTIEDTVEGKAAGQRLINTGRGAVTADTIAALYAADGDRGKFGREVARGIVALTRTPEEERIENEIPFLKRAARDGGFNCVVAKMYDAAAILEEDDFARIRGENDDSKWIRRTRKAIYRCMIAKKISHRLFREMHANLKQKGHPSLKADIELLRTKSITQVYAEMIGIMFCKFRKGLDLSNVEQFLDAGTAKVLGVYNPRAESLETPEMTGRRQKREFVELEISADSTSAHRFLELAYETLGPAGSDGTPVWPYKITIAESMVPPHDRWSHLLKVELPPRGEMDYYSFTLQLFVLRAKLFDPSRVDQYKKALERYSQKKEANGGRPVPIDAAGFDTLMDEALLQTVFDRVSEKVKPS